MDSRSVGFGASNTTARLASRIDSDIERVKTMTDIVNSSTDRITRHAHSLGYFDPPKVDHASAGNAPVAVSVTLADALADLQRAVDRNSGALNLFD